MQRRRALLAGPLAAAALLAGCSSVRVVDSEVRSFAAWPPGQPHAGSVYTFERLPSQQAQPERQARMEAAARAQFDRIGWVPASASALPRYSVQISTGLAREAHSPWDPPLPGWGMPGRDYVVTGNGQIVWLPMPPRSDFPWFRRQVLVVVRDLVAPQVVFETRAQHEGRWADDEAVIAPMIEAALRDFPAPPPGPRTIELVLPR